MSEKSKLTILNEIFGIIASLIVVFTFSWELITGVFSGMSIQAKKTIEIEKSYFDAYNELISGDINQAEKIFRKISREYPNYRNIYETLSIFEEAKQNFTTTNSKKKYILQRIKEENLAPTTLKIYDKIDEFLKKN